MLELTEVSKTLQTNSINGWVYRITVSDHVTINRVPECEQMWNHGVICQWYDGELGKFVVGCTANYRDCMLNTTLEEAVKIIEKMVD